MQDAAAFNNDTISAPYEPGSDIKTLTVATGLDKGVIQPDSTYTNTDSIKVEDRTIGNATKGPNGQYYHAARAELFTEYRNGNNCAAAGRWSEH